MKLVRGAIGPSVPSVFVPCAVIFIVFVPVLEPILDTLYLAVVVITGIGLLDGKIVLYAA